MDTCIFCKIVKKEIATKFVDESDNVIVFEDINPKADIHLLIVPKYHVGSFLDIGGKHFEIFHDMIVTAQKIIKVKNLQSGAYRLVFNGGLAQYVPHLHWHLLGGSLIGVPE